MVEEQAGPARNVFDFAKFAQNPELETSYWVDDLLLSRSFGAILPPALKDLVNLAMAVYYADRRSRRHRSAYEFTGHRDIHIRLPVSEIGKWRSKTIQKSLVDLLSWFTEDSWEFDFFEPTIPFVADHEGFLFQTPVAEPNVALLFSGGLDSLAGLSNLMERCPDHSFVLVSCCTSQRVAQIQRDLIRELVRFWQTRSRELRSVVIPFGIGRSQGKPVEETSQRSRGFVFLLMGAVAAMMAKSPKLCICENGIGAVNLPFNEGQLGIDNTRGVHPMSLARMSDFLSLVVGGEPSIINPFEFNTKGEMCLSLRRLGLGGLVGKSISCDAFPLRIHGSPSQCGTCSSCLLRRCSLHAAGLERSDSGSGYRFDIKDSFVGISEKKLYPLMAMLDQVERIRECLAAKEPWSSLTETFPELLEIQHDMSRRRGVELSNIAESYVRMYSLYVKEWDSFPLSVK